MADKKVSQLTQVTTLPDTAKIYAVDLTRAVDDQDVQIAVSYTHLTLPTNREV